MNIDYVELNDMALVTDENGRLKKIENTDNTKDILIAENKVESLEEAISELETKLVVDKYIYRSGLRLLIATLILEGVTLYLSFVVISTSLLPKGLITSPNELAFTVLPIPIFILNFKLIQNIKRICTERKGLKKTIALLKERLGKERKELERIKSAKSTLVETKTSQITHLEETKELLKFKKYLVAMKYYSTKLAELKRMDKKHELEEYLSLLNNPEMETDINMILSRTPEQNKNF